MSWAAKLKTIADKGKVDLGELCKSVKIELFSGVVSDTRVGNPSAWKSPPPPGYVGGRLRGNWQTQETIKPSGQIDRIDPTGSAVQAEIEATASADGVTYFVNNLPYAKVWEEEDAMVARNVARVYQIVTKKARELKS